MVTCENAIHTFFSSFSIPAYQNTAVPDSAKMPYITYDMPLGFWGDPDVSFTVNVWYYSESEAGINAKCRELAEAIGMGGKTLLCDSGVIWLKRGTPWCQPVQTESDNNIKRRFLNVDASYLTV